MKYWVLLLIAGPFQALLTAASDAPSMHSAPFTEARTKDNQLNDWLTYIGVQPLNQVLKAHKAKRVFRLVASSSWTTDVFTVLDVGKREVRFDGRKAEGGYLLLLDRAKWENERQLFSSVRTVRALNANEAMRFAQVVNLASLTHAAEQKMGGPHGLPLDGGCTAFDWLDRGRIHGLVYGAQTTASGEDHDLATLVTGFYNLLK